MSLYEAINILTQIGQALHYAHEQHIVHRDLKPENILFNQAGKPLLADFGIAVLLATAHTKLVGIGGTPPYMAPEQFEGLASTKSDQYALGCIAYELFTGRRVFTVPSPTLEAYWYHHAKVEPTPPTHFNPQLPANIEQAILRALSKDRASRHTDIPTFGKELLKSKAVAIVNGFYIMQPQHDLVIRLKVPYLHYRIQALRKQSKIDPFYEKQIEEEIVVIQGLLASPPRQLHDCALKDLVEDRFIQEGIAAEEQTKANSKYLYPERELKSVLKDFNDYLREGYQPLLISIRLTENDVREVLLIYTRRDCFARYLHDWKSTQLKEWLAKRWNKALIQY